MPNTREQRWARGQFGSSKARCQWFVVPASEKSVPKDAGARWCWRRAAWFLRQEHVCPPAFEAYRYRRSARQLVSFACRSDLARLSAAHGDGDGLSRQHEGMRAAARVYLESIGVLESDMEECLQSLAPPVRSASELPPPTFRCPERMPDGCIVLAVQPRDLRAC
eukprot:TRINITY_DN3840_c0_g1_i1.p1 TRINITY_DN3840_c0_g1~~TRINITY_DN3840_c0_g1_i1.p1  ORF type:complete len:165 (-),score=4.87 TRINITY_DN3840_c0_g1_i1:90-584(-)